MMTAEPTSEAFHFSVARDVGNIELLRARFHRRGLPPHWHDEYSIGVSLRGGLGFDDKGVRYLAPSGVVSCVAPGEVHNAYSSGDANWEFVCLLVPVFTVREILHDLECKTDLPDLPRRILADLTMAERIKLLHRQLTTDRDLLARQSNSLQVLGDFFQRYSTLRLRPTAVSVQPDRVRRVRDLLHDCFATSIQVSQLAACAGLSPYYFLRMFRAAVGMTPHAYLNQIRVLEAKRRLAEGTPPAEAAIACGFYDQSHMTRQFKRTACVTPGDYRGAFACRLHIAPTDGDAL